jgi:hypothetical protein
VLRELLLGIQLDVHDGNYLWVHSYALKIEHLLSKLDKRLVSPAVAAECRTTVKAVRSDPKIAGPVECALKEYRLATK